MSVLYPSLTRTNMPDLPRAEALLPYLQRMDKECWYTNFGPLVGAFEQKLQTYLAALDSITTSTPIALTTVATGYHALLIGLQLFHLPPNARVLVPAVTFPACPLAIQHTGGTPVFADVDAHTWTLTPEIARRITARTKIHAVMPVAVYGVPLPVAAWDAFSEETGIPVLIDAAAALGVQAIPQHGLVAFSLHATKPFGVGEGGVLVGRDPTLIEAARRRSNFGTRASITLSDGSNAKMSEYHGAVALAQFDRWDEVRARRAHVSDLYQKHIPSALSFQDRLDDAVMSCLMLASATITQDKIHPALQAKGIATHRTYLPPLYAHPHFQEGVVASEEGVVLEGTVALETRRKIMHNSERMAQTIFGVPFHAFLTEEDVRYVGETLEKILESAAVRAA